jgi:hypothetical protein
MSTFKFHIAIVLMLLNINNSFSQIYAKNAYMYVADNYVFAQGNVNLDTGGNIYLRNESQLLQATTSTSTNKGVGKLSAFQEGTSNAFKYNSWCSPVGNASATVGNENFGITMLNRPTDVTNSTPATVTHNSNYNGVSNPLNIEPYWIWKYIQSSIYCPGCGGWISVQAASTLAAGEGFTMKGSGTGMPLATIPADFDTTSILGVQNNPDGLHQRYDFRGKPNDGNIDIAIDVNAQTLTGNPYPSAIDLSKFLFSNTALINGTAYFWEHSKTSPNSHLTVGEIGGYGVFTPVSLTSMGVYVPATFYAYTVDGNQIPSPTYGTGGNYERRFSPIGQGFFIEGKSTLSGPTTVQMNNSYRVFMKEDALATISHFERNPNTTTPPSQFLPEIPSVSGFDYTTVSKLPVPQIRFKSILNDFTVQQMTLAFDNAATDGLDFGMDGLSANAGSTQEVYFNIENKTYAIDLVQFDINKRIPIGLRNSSNVDANFKISILEMVNFSDAEHVYVHDKISDEYHEITNDTFEVVMPSGDNKTRFEITFINTPALATVSIVNNNFTVFQDNDNQFLTVSNPKSLDIKEVNLYDISGKLVFNKTKLGVENSYKFSTNGLSESVYLVNITTTDGIKQGEKISVYRTK